MKLIDITRDYTKAPLYPGSKLPEIKRVCDMSKGDMYNASSIVTTSHIGTHADAFCHFLKDSNISIEKMKLEHYYGRCIVMSFKPDTPIELSDVEGKLKNVERLVIHSGGFSYLTKQAAEYIANSDVITIVTDAWSVAPLDNEPEIHEIILGNDIAVIENVVLDDVEDGEYILSAFPVKYDGCDGAPVRAVLIEK